MKIAILGAGFTGLTVALRLSQKGHEVTVFEKEETAGGLASGFKDKSWQWSLEKSYHHFFTNDSYVSSLAKEVGQEILTKRPLTAIYYKPPKDQKLKTNDYILPFDSPLNLLLFPYLSMSQKTRTGLTLAFLKLTNNYRSLEKYAAYEWLEKYMGKTAFDILFKPLFIGKFGNYAKTISMAWFWARIKKRTSSLAYPVGGYQSFIDKLIQKIGSAGGKVFLNDPVNEIQKEDNSKFKIACPSEAKQRGENSKFDAVISTLPSPVFLKLTQNLNVPSNYIKLLTNINHLYALNLILELKEPFFQPNKAGGAGGKPATGPASQPSYWLNINDTSFPFLALVEHTNFMDKKHYGNHHLLYIGNYLPEGHEFLKKSKEELLKIFDPYLKNFNPGYSKFLVQNSLFASAFAQPIITTGYTSSPLETGLKNLYAGNLDNVYPWDRGTNYAIELGEKLAKTITQ